METTDKDSVNLITAGSRFEGVVEFDGYTRFEGYVHGTLKGGPGTQLIIGENGVVDGQVKGDSIVIDGFVRGDVFATGRVVVMGTGRVIGQITAPSVSIRFGGYFDGKCSMLGAVQTGDETAKPPKSPKKTPEPSPSA